MNWLSVFPALIVAALAAEAMRRVSNSYEAICGHLRAELDSARADNATLRTALFPQLARLAQAPPKTAAATAAKPPAAPFNFTPRVPWRIRFCQNVVANNTRQTGRDKMTNAIQKAQPQPADKETSHA